MSQFSKSHKFRIALVLSLFLIGFLIIITVAALSVNKFSHVPTEDLKYCKLKSCEGQDHVMCKYIDTLGDCGKCVCIEGQREKILKLHNDFRDKVGMGKEERGKDGKPQPPYYDAKGNGPKPIPTLKWDYELERIAQRWAQQCRVDKPPCLNTPVYNVKENHWYSISPNTSYGDYEAIFNHWEQNAYSFGVSDVKEFREDKDRMQFYPQLVWEKSRRVGCALLKCTRFQVAKTWLTCLYAPGGNADGQPIYTTKP